MEVATSWDLQTRGLHYRRVFSPGGRQQAAVLFLHRVAIVLFYADDFRSWQHHFSSPTHQIATAWKVLLSQFPGGKELPVEIA